MYRNNRIMNAKVPIASAILLAIEMEKKLSI